MRSCNKQPGPCEDRGRKLGSRGFRVLEALSKWGLNKGSIKVPQGSRGLRGVGVYVCFLVSGFGKTLHRGLYMVLPNLDFWACRPAGRNPIPTDCKHACMGRSSLTSRFGLRVLGF